MKKNRMKIVASIFSAALLVSAGSVISQRGDVTEVNAVTEASVASIPVTNQVNVVNIDANGNRFINQSLFTVNKTFEQCQQVAAAQIQGGQVIAHKQDADKGKFIYEFIVKGSNGLFYEVDVETENGTVTKVELEDDFDFYKYTQVSSTQQTTVQQPVQTPQVQQVASTNNGLETAKNVVLKKFPGATFLKIKQDWDDGVMEYEFTIKTKDGIVYDVEVVNNWIKDIDYEGKYVNGIFYED